MSTDLEFYGVFIPRLLILMLVALVINIVLRKVLSFLRFYALVWHRGLFDLALYILILGGLVSATHWTDL